MVASPMPDDGSQHDETAPPVPPPPAPVPPVGHALADKDARMWAAFAHLAGLIYLVGVPGIVGSLVIWLIQRDKHPFVDAHGKEAVNFQLTLLLYNVAIFVIGVCSLGLGMIVIAPLALVVAVLVIVLPIIATVKASEGEPYRYPLTIRLID